MADELIEQRGANPLKLSRDDSLNVVCNYGVLQLSRLDPEFTCNNAVALFTDAAQRGCLVSKNNLAVCRALGLGMEADFEGAYRQLVDLRKTSLRSFAA